MQDQVNIILREICRHLQIYKALKVCSQTTRPSGASSTSTGGTLRARAGRSRLSGRRVVSLLPSGREARPHQCRHPAPPQPRTAVLAALRVPDLRAHFLGRPPSRQAPLPPRRALQHQLRFEQQQAVLRALRRRLRYSSISPSLFCNKTTMRASKMTRWTNLWTTTTTTCLREQDSSRTSVSQQSTLRSTRRSATTATRCSILIARPAVCASAWDPSGASTATCV